MKITVSDYDLRVARVSVANEETMTSVTVTCKACDIRGRREGVHMPQVMKDAAAWIESHEKDHHE